MKSQQRILTAAAMAIGGLAMVGCSESYSQRDRDEANLDTQTAGAYQPTHDYSGTYSSTDINQRDSGVRSGSVTAQPSGSQLPSDASASGSVSGSVQRNDINLQNQSRQDQFNGNSSSASSSQQQLPGTDMKGSSSVGTSGIDQSAQPAGGAITGSSSSSDWNTSSSSAEPYGTKDKDKKHKPTTLPSTAPAGTSSSTWGTGSSSDVGSGSSMSQSGISSPSGSSSASGSYQSGSSSSGGTSSSSDLSAQPAGSGMSGQSTSSGMSTSSGSSMGTGSSSDSTGLSSSTTQPTTRSTSSSGLGQDTASPAGSSLNNDQSLPSQSPDVDH